MKIKSILCSIVALALLSGCAGQHGQGQASPEHSPAQSETAQEAKPSLSAQAQGQEEKEGEIDPLLQEMLQGYEGRWSCQEIDARSPRAPLPRDAWEAAWAAQLEMQGEEGKVFLEVFAYEGEKWRWREEEINHKFELEWMVNRITDQGQNGKNYLQFAYPYEGAMGEGMAGYLEYLGEDGSGMDSENIAFLRAWGELILIRVKEQPKPELEAAAWAQARDMIYDLEGRYGESIASREESYWYHHRARAKQEGSLTLYEYNGGYGEIPFFWAYDLGEYGREGWRLEITEAPYDRPERFTGRLMQGDEQRQTLALDSWKLEFEDLDGDGRMDIRESNFNVWLDQGISEGFAYDGTHYWRQEEYPPQISESASIKEASKGEVPEEFPLEKSYRVKAPGGASMRLEARLESIIEWSEIGDEYLYQVEVYERAGDKEPVSCFSYSHTNGWGNDLNFIDLNADGYQDIEVCWQYGANGGAFDYYVYNPALKGFYKMAGAGGNGLVPRGDGSATCYNHETAVEGSETLWVWYRNEMRLLRRIDHDFGIQGEIPGKDGYFEVEEYFLGKGERQRLYEGCDYEEALSFFERPAGIG